MGGAARIRRVGTSKRTERRGRDFWAGVVSEFERTELTQQGFCLSRGLEVAAFRHWLYQLRRERGSGRKKPVVRFVPLIASSVSSGPLKVRVGEVELSFAELPAASYLAELLRLMDRLVGDAGTDLRLMDR